jgi:hypothetical protein
MIIVAAALVLTAIGVMIKSSTTPMTVPAPLPASALPNVRVFFAHQSVGANILDGVRAIAPQVSIQRGETPPTGPGIVETLVGRNGDPEGKLEHFARAMTAMHGGVDVAILKFCYVDFSASTNITRVQQRYRETLARLKSDHPGTRFVHVTVPLTITQRGPKALVKRALGRPIFGETENPVRSDFNDWLRRTYAGEPLFDLAAVESRTPDGEPVTFTVSGRTYPMLYPGYSDDGQHLARGGREIVAAQFLAEIERAGRGERR